VRGPFTQPTHYIKRARNENERTHALLRIGTLGVAGRTFVPSTARFILAARNIAAAAPHMSHSSSKRSKTSSETDSKAEYAAKDKLLKAKDAKDGQAALGIFRNLVAAAGTAGGEAGEAGKRRVSAGLCSLVMSVLVDSGQRALGAGALEIFAHVQDKSESLSSNTIRALCLDDKLDDALGVLASMTGSEKNKPRHRSFSPILACACRLGRLDVAQSIFARMSEEYINRPNEEDCATVLQGWCAAPRQRDH